MLEVRTSIPRPISSEQNETVFNFSDDVIYNTKFNKTYLSLFVIPSM